jgi:hypothetical protein
MRGLKKLRCNDGKRTKLAQDRIQWQTLVFLYYLRTKSAYHSGRAVYGMNRLRPLEHLDHGFESHSSHGCLCAFILCLFYSICRSRPCDGADPLSKESHRLCID